MHYVCEISGSDELSPESMSHMQVLMPNASSSALRCGLVNLAAHHTSLLRAKSSAIGPAIYPVAPVTRVLRPTSMAPS